MEEKVARLKTLLGDMVDLGRIAGLLNWDQRVYMPPEGADARGSQLALLAGLLHERATSPELQDLLAELKPYANSLDPASDEACMIRVAARNMDQMLRIPGKFVEELEIVTTQANMAWIQARHESCFDIFCPHMEKIVALSKQYAAFFPEFDHPYDALLDVYEPGMKTAEVRTIFERLRPLQVALIQAIQARPQVDASFLRQPFEEQAQWNFCSEVLAQVGFDEQRGRQDKTAHPFTIGLGGGDVRITTRVAPNFFNTMFFGSLHECGHALYALGAAPELDRLGLAEGASLAVHESQSRTWENLVGRSLPFWRFFYPRLQSTFPQLADVSLDTFYKGINQVMPSLIRVEADEATYNLHIMLRLEIEIALLEGHLTVKDLPEYWNLKTQEYLGVNPPDDARGVLQDAHWSTGKFGYFPTYALGNLISAQLWEKINQDLPDLDAQISRGEFGGLLAWQREKIHRHGSKFEPQDLVRQAAGSGIDPEPYMAYLERKYSEIYGFSLQ